MKTLLLILTLLVLSLSVHAADRITATITVTNTPSDSNTLVVNSDTRTWKTTVATPATQIGISTNGIGANATNLFLHIAANPFTGPLVVQQTATNVVTVTGTVGGALAASLTGTWGSISLSTQTITSAYAVRVPATAEPDATTRQTIWNGVIDAINDQATGTLDSTAAALANFVNTDEAQTVSGDKTFSGETKFTDSVTVTNAQQYFRTGAGITIETNVPIVDLNSTYAFWQFNTSEATNSIVTFTGVTNKLDALKAADNSWTGLQTFTRATGGMTNVVMTNSATGAGTFTLGSELSYTRNNHSTLANGNNSGVTFTRVYNKIKAGPTATFVINGIAGGTDGRMVILDNATGQTMTIANDSGTEPTPANRIYTRTGTDVSTGTGGCVTLVYDSESSRWILVTFNAGGAGVTSVGLAVPAPFDVSGTPVVSAGTITISIPAGITNAANWNTEGSSTNSALTGIATANGLVATNSLTTGTRLDFLTDLQLWRNGVQYADSDSTLLYYLKGASLRADSWVSGGSDLKFASDNEVTVKATIDAATGDFTTLGRLIIATSTPASASATGTTGTIAWDSDYIYICVGTDTWKRAAIATWP